MLKTGQRIEKLATTETIPEKTHVKGSSPKLSASGDRENITENVDKDVSQGRLAKRKCVIKRARGKGYHHSMRRANVKPALMLLYSCNSAHEFHVTDIAHEVRINHVLEC